MNQRLRALSDAGVSIWLDDLSRQRLTSGSLAELIAQDSVVGVTTNPSIFAAAVKNSADYAEQMRALASAPLEQAIKELCATDVRDACDLFAPTFTTTDGEDGRVSIEVEPGLAHDTAATIAQAAELRALVDRENVLIKIPATAAGLPAITEADITESERTLTDWILNERFVEFYGEGHRFYDLRRYMVAPQYLSAGKREGLNAVEKMNPTFAEFNQRVKVNQPYKWSTRMYILPIIQSEIGKNTNLVQAPGY